MKCLQRALLYLSLSISLLKNLPAGTSQRSWYHLGILSFSPAEGYKNITTYISKNLILWYYFNKQELLIKHKALRSQKQIILKPYFLSVKSSQVTSYSLIGKYHGVSIYIVTATIASFLWHNVSAAY